MKKNLPLKVWEEFKKINLRIFLKSSIGKDGPWNLDKNGSLGIHELEI